MRTIALRFSNNFAPGKGTIGAHNHVIDELGYAWYGKLGSKISTKVADDIMKEHAMLSMASKHSMSPYFIIDCDK